MMMRFTKLEKLNKKQQPENSKTKIIEVIQKSKTKKINETGITKTICNFLKILLFSEI